MAEVVVVKVQGLREFQAALRELDDGLPKLLRTTMNDALELVADDARRRVPTKTGRARASVKVQSSQREGRIKAGSAKAPYYPWLEFGGRVGRDQSVRRPFLQGGRYIYVSWAKHRDDVTELLGDGLADLARAAGLQVTEGGVG